MKKEINERIKKIKKGEIPEGYKKVNSKVVPRDWSLVALKELTTLISGQHINANDYNNKKLGVPYITGPSDFNNGIINITKYTDKPKAICKVNDILITVKGSGVGKVIISDGEYCISRQLMALRTSPEKVKFLYYYFKSKENQYNFDSAGLIPGITRDDINNSMVSIPNLSEEFVLVGDIFSLWDNAIELKEKLIKQKKQQKKGLMQKLLIGQVRLSGFDGEWEKVKIGICMTELSEKSTLNNQYDVLSVTKNGIVKQNEHFNKQIASEDNVGYKVIRKQNLVFSTMNLWMGSLDVLENYEIGIVSPAYKVFEFNNENMCFEFGKHFMKSSYMIWNYKINSEQGASIVRRNLDMEGLMDTKVKIPSLQEQKAIAAVLTTADKEIELLQKELDALKEQKKGLMQLLLTGIVRVA